MYELSYFRNNLDAVAARLADRGFTGKALSAIEEALADAFAERLWQRMNVREQEATNDPRDAELRARLRDLVQRLPPAAPPREP